MPKRTDIKKILIIGSGPTVIGQAAEFDYTATQACIALKEEGYETVVVNSDPATIMTDKENADHVYIEPVTTEFLSRVLRKELPDAILPTFGGQTALNLAGELVASGILTELNIEILGTKNSVIEQTEDPDLLKKLLTSLNQPVQSLQVVTTEKEALACANEIGYPVFVRPLLTLAGAASNICYNEHRLKQCIAEGLNLSPAGQCIVEQSLSGFKEIEFEVLRDSADNALAVGNIENFDPVGTHSGDSLAFVPSQTLTDHEYQLLRDVSLQIIHALKIDGSCHVRLALDPQSFNYYVLDINARLTRSSVLISKATAYPIARIAAKVAVGMSLAEIKNPMTEMTSANFEPSLDYVVTKIPRWPFDLRKSAQCQLNTQMKSVGEVMALGRNLEESLLKAIQSLASTSHIELDSLKQLTDDDLTQKIVHAQEDRLFALAESLRRGYNTIEELAEITKIDLLFLDKIAHIVEIESLLSERKDDFDVLKVAKQNGFSDQKVAQLWHTEKEKILYFRKQQGLSAVFKMVDSCAGEFIAKRPYFYRSYETENESSSKQKPAILLLGAGPIGIGQGLEFDYANVQAISAVQQAGYEAIVINDNPSSLSTDFMIADKLYFEPLTSEAVYDIVEQEKPVGVIGQFGGTSTYRLSEELAELGINLLAMDLNKLQEIKDPLKFDRMLKTLEINPRQRQVVSTEKEALASVESMGFPIAIRSYDLFNEDNVRRVDEKETLAVGLNYLKHKGDSPLLVVENYTSVRECEADIIYDGSIIFIAGITEYIERSDVHSGDSITVYPAQNFSKEVLQKVEVYSKQIIKHLDLIGVMNIQFVISENPVYVNRVLPYASRSLPFLSKIKKVPLVQIATRVILGDKLEDMEYNMSLASKEFYVKAPVFSLTNLVATDSYLKQEMKSTGTVMGSDISLEKALYKAFAAAGLAIPEFGSVLFTVADKDKEMALQLAQSFSEVGFNITATQKTAEYFDDHGLKVRKLAKSSTKNEQTIFERLENGHIQMIINTVRPNRQNVSYNSLAIFRKAVEQGIAVFTSLDTVVAILKVIQSRSFSTKEI